MIIDGQLRFSSAQDISGSNNVVSTNVVDLSEVRNVGEGKVLYLTTAVTLVFTDGGTNAGTQVILYGGATAGATTSDGKWMYSIPQVAAVGSGPYFAPLPVGLLTTMATDYEFLQVNYKPQTANLTQGKVTTDIVTDIQAFVAYARGYTIS